MDIQKKPTELNKQNFVKNEYKSLVKYLIVGRDSSVGIAASYGLDWPGIESRWGRNFPHPSRPATIIKRDTVIDVRRCACKVPVFLVRF